MLRGAIALAGAVTLGACGDNLPPIGLPIGHADTLFVIAHFDDDMIFMQPELLHALEQGSTATVYVASGDPVHGDDRAEHTYEAAMQGYEVAARSSHWDCGYTAAATSPVHHCHLIDRDVSMIGLDLPDGGIEGAGTESLLHLVQGDVSSLRIRGLVGGTATTETIIDELAAIIVATQPSQIHALDLAATHGRDHSSHMFSSSFLLWAAARAGYAGEIRWHRGYNVETEAPTLADADRDAVFPMLSFFEACYFGCAACGTGCTTLDPAHEIWLRRQYSWTRTRTASGVLENAEGSCAIANGAALALGDCAAAPAFQLDATGALSTGGACVTAGETATLAPCTGKPEQLWWFDSEGALWSAALPAPGPDMAFDHVRCLAGPTAPVCGSRLHPTWALR